MSPLPPSPLPDALGRFRPARVVGVGGSGMVYEVYEGTEHEGGPFALKVLRDDMALSVKEQRRFLDEAERMARVSDRGLVPLLESGLLPDGRPYLLMPLLEGVTLAERLRSGPLSMDDAVRFAAELGRALHAMHQANMIHRDIKPENIAVVRGEDGRERPVLLDFGIARDIDGADSTTTAVGRIRGTPAYMAPERFFGAQASVRSDVYELAVTAYMMLAGRLPWGSEESVTERLNPPDPTGYGVTRSIARALLRALSTRPEVRPETALELVVELERALADGPGSSRHTADLAPLAPRTAPDLALQDTEHAAVSADATARTHAAGAPPERRSAVGWLVGLAGGAMIALAVGAYALGARGQGPDVQLPSGAPPAAEPSAPTALPAVHGEVGVAKGASELLPESAPSTKPTPSTPRAAAPAKSGSAPAAKASGASPSSSAPRPASSDELFIDRQ